MRRGVWTFVLFLLIAVVSVSAIPQTDQPETPYNEVDTPVNQAPPVVLGIRFVRPTKIAVIVPKKVRESDWNLDAPVSELLLPSLSSGRDSHALQDLLCTLLI